MKGAFNLTVSNIVNIDDTVKFVKHVPQLFTCRKIVDLSNEAYFMVKCEKKCAKKCKCKKEEKCYVDKCFKKCAKKSCGLRIENGKIEKEDDFEFDEEN